MAADHLSQSKHLDKVTDEELKEARELVYRLRDPDTTLVARVATVTQNPQVTKELSKANIVLEQEKDVWVGTSGTWSSLVRPWRPCWRRLVTLR